MRTCYLLAWCRESPTGALTIESAGLYSESGDTITHELHSSAPLQLLTIQGDDYHDAFTGMERCLKDRLEMEGANGRPLSVYARICKMALEGRVRNGQ